MHLQTAWKPLLFSASEPEAWATECPSGLSLRPVVTSSHLFLHPVTPHQAGG